MGGEELAVLVEQRIDRYLERCRDGATIPSAVREAVAYAAARVPVAVVSGAFRREIEPVLGGAGLDRHVSVLVAADDVERGKPDPAGYVLGAELLGVPPAEIAAFEDTEAGVASAKGAGAYCVAVVGTHQPARLAAADELVEALDLAVVGRLLG